MAIIRELFVKFGFVTDDKGAKKLDKTMGSVRGSLDDTAKKAKAFAISVGASLAAAFGVNAAKEFLASQGEIVEKLATYSVALGESTEATQRYGFAAREAGVEFDDFAQATLDITERASDATVNGGGMAEMFGRLGIVLSDTNGIQKSGVSLLLETTDALKALPSAAQRTEIGMAILGDTYGRMSRVIDGGSEAFRESANSADAFASVIGDDAFAATKALSKSQRLLTDSARQFANVLLVKAAPAIQAVISGITKLLREGDLLRKVLNGARIAATLFVAALASRQVVKFAQTLALLAKGAIGASRALFTTRGAVVALQAAMAALPLAAAGLILFLQDVSTYVAGGASVTGDFITKFRDADGALGGVARTLETMSPLLAEFFNGLVRVATQALPMVKAGLMGLVGILTGSLGVAFKIISSILSTIGPSVLGSLGPIASTIMAIVGQVSGFINQVITALAPIFAAVFEAIIKVMPKILEAVQAVIGAILSILTPLLDIFIANIDIIIGVILAMLPVVVFVIETIASIISALAPIIADVIGFAAGIIGGLAKTIMTIVDFLGGILSPIADAAFAFWDALGDAIRPIINMMKEAARLASKIPGVSSAKKFFGFGGSSSSGNTDAVGGLKISSNNDLQARSRSAGARSSSRSSQSVNVGDISINTGATVATGSQLVEVAGALLNGVTEDAINRTTDRSTF